MPTARAGACAAELNGQLFIAGGYGDSTEGASAITNIVECYDPFTNRYLRYRHILSLVKVKECSMYRYFSFETFMISCTVFIVLCNCFADGCKEAVCALVVAMPVSLVSGTPCTSVVVWLQTGTQWIPSAYRMWIFTMLRMTDGGWVTTCLGMLHITAQHRLPQVGNPDTLQWALINQLILEEKNTGSS